MYHNIQEAEQSMMYADHSMLPLGLAKCLDLVYCILHLTPRTDKYLAFPRLVQHDVYIGHLLTSINQVKI